jgi:hypothetical protein
MKRRKPDLCPIHECSKETLVELVRIQERTIDTLFHLYELKEMGKLLPTSHFILVHSLN